MDSRRVAIDIIGAGYAYPEGAEAVKGASLAIREGEFVAIVGANGSGKSTLAKLMNALILPTSGEVIVCGARSERGEAQFTIREACGMAFQNPDNQLVASIVEEDVAFGPENLGIDPPLIRGRVDEALKAVGMYENRLSAPESLSGGQKQRVAIAGILAMRPRAIVFDEATSMLDPMGREDVFAAAMGLCRGEGIAVAWITHFMEEAARADRVIVMGDGGILMEGAPREAFMRAGELEAAGVGEPFAARLARELREAGIPVAEGVLSAGELAAELARLNKAIGEADKGGAEGYVGRD